MRFIQANSTCQTVDLTQRKCESAAKSIVLLVFYPNNMVPLWCTEQINSHITGKPPRLFSITHNDEGIPLQNRWTEKWGKKEVRGERTITEKGFRQRFRNMI